MIEAVLVDLSEGKPEVTLKGIKVVDEEDHSAPGEPIVSEEGDVECEGGRVRRVNAALATDVL